jgi:hypothetical protein
MTKLIKTSLTLTLLGSGLAGIAHGATRTASSCDRSAVQTAIDAAADGDTVTVPAGTCTWTSAVTLSNKTITLKGAGSDAGGTKILYGGGGHTLISVDAGSKTGKTDISGFWLQGGDANYWGGMSMEITGPAAWKNLRVHHMVFDDNKNWALRVNAATYGVIDHCTFQGAAHGITLTGRGKSDWSTPLVLGSADFFFIEDNTFKMNDDYGNTGRAAVDWVQGGRLVIRHNSLTANFVETHDRARSGSTFASANAWEIYENTFSTGTTKWKGIDLSAGTGVVWRNTFNGDWMVPIGAMDYKKTQWSSHPNVAACDGNDPVDQNVPGQSGWHCQYQIGSQGEGPSATSYPAYIWNNTVSGGKGSSGMVVTDNAGNLQAGRDYVNNGTTAKPGYTPYTYPHPLTQASSSAPSLTAPSNLRITP